MLEEDLRAWWAIQLLTDFAASDPNAYHNFLWANHLGYAKTYEIEQRFGYENFNESRKTVGTVRTQKCAKSAKVALRRL